MNGERWQTISRNFSSALTSSRFRSHPLRNGDDDLQFRQVKELLKSGIDVLVFSRTIRAKLGASSKPRTRNMFQ